MLQKVYGSKIGSSSFISKFVGGYDYDNSNKYKFADNIEGSGGSNEGGKGEGNEGSKEASKVTMADNIRETITRGINNLLNRDLPQQTTTSINKSQNVQYMGAIDSPLGYGNNADSFDIYTSNIDSNTFDNVSSVDAKLAIGGLSRGNRYERQIIGQTNKYKHVSSYLKEDCDNVENRDWWGNTDI